MELTPQIEQKMISDIRDIVEKHMNSYSYILQHGKKYIIYNEYILEKTKNFPDLPYSTRIYWILNNITEYPKCQNPNCSKELKHDLRCNPIYGYVSTTCSHSCGQKTQHRNDALKKTSMEKYGVEHPSQSKQFKEKFNGTISKRTKDEINKSNEKRKQTCIEKYGVDSISKVSSIIDKKKKTFNSKTQDEKLQTQLKTQKTKLERYGNSHFVNGEKQSNTRHNFSEQKNLEINNTRKATTQKLYGVDNVSQLQDVRDKISKKLSLSSNIKFFNNVISNNQYVEPLFTLDYFLNHSHDTLNWRCKKCGKEFKSKKFYHYINSQVPARCLDCYPLTQPISNGEKEIVQFIKTFYNGEIIENTRKVISPMELDIWIPNKKIAIEYNGVYWHSENMGTPNDYHLNKTLMCNKLGIHLVHIFDVEWHSQKSIVESRLRSIIDGSETKIFARKCEVCIIGKDEADQFINANHIQGQCAFKTAIGLKFNKELVSVMTFGKPRFTQEYDCELLRFCNKLGTQVVGGASRLLAHYEREFKLTTIVSYADRRWSIGNVYEQLGFAKTSETKPNYWYWNYGESSNYLENRVRYQKYKLSKILKTYDKNKTEVENMRDNGFFRIFDCGNLVYVKVKCDKNELSK